MKNEFKKELDAMQASLDKLKSLAVEPEPIEMVSGRWYKIHAHGEDWIFLFNEIDESGRVWHNGAFSPNDMYYDPKGMFRRNEAVNPIPASEPEIQSLLTKYCTETLGIKAGVTVERSEDMMELMYGCTLYPEKSEIFSDGIKYYSDKDRLSIGGILVYIAGHFATVVDEVVTVDGKEVEVTNAIKPSVEINGWWFGLAEIDALHTALTCSDPLTAEKCEKLLKKMGGKGE